MILTTASQSSVDYTHTHTHGLVQRSPLIRCLTSVTVIYLRFIADHDVILHGIGDVVDGEHQAGTIFDAGKTRTCPRHHVAGSVSSMNGCHIRLRHTDTLSKSQCLSELFLLYTTLQQPLYTLTELTFHFRQDDSCVCSVLYSTFLECSLIKQLLQRRELLNEL